ncbi:hypothetical protein WA1_24130 [Scytonema hofmannii PCC 7110]|uniref:CopG family transcriptional regulator n=1 Tax=Scytonema hofmannii PCC 7110 TaxID=128403 RepID=A0A139X7P7_9CYAN|nr:hypothetical protein [Scytonema hofmannii]KYC40731.1 hypothetical protein WA1_24130 [Scytonema hofmannii PCC 7110]USN26950.1 hypothetical protein [synthetic construct]
MTKTKRQRTFISIEIDPETKTAFSEKLEREGKTVTAVLKQFIDDYLKAETEEVKKWDLGEVIKRLEIVERKVGIENARLVGETSA